MSTHDDEWIVTWHGVPYEVRSCGPGYYCEAGDVPGCECPQDAAHYLLEVGGHGCRFLCETHMQGNHLCSEEAGPCWHCGQPTRWVEINYQTWLCPGACTEAKDREFEEELRSPADTKEAQEFVSGLIAAARELSNKGQ